MGNPRSDIRAIFDAGLKAADPGEAIRHSVTLEGKLLLVGDRHYDLGSFDRVMIVGAGKAAASMAAALEDILGPYLTEGIITTKYGHGCSLKTVKKWGQSLTIILLWLTLDARGASRSPNILKSMAGILLVKFIFGDKLIQWEIPDVHSI